MHRGIKPTVAAAAVLLLASVGGTSPVAGPTTTPVDPAIARAFDRLADPDPAARNAAREQLMGVSRDGLDQLLAVVRSARQVRPAQAAALYDVVVHAFLATDPDGLGGPDPVLVRGYKMGLRWPLAMTQDGRIGVPVMERWPGFPAYRLLRDGDLIVGIYMHPEQPLDQLPNRATPRPIDIRRAIADAPAVRDIDLAVLRDGRSIRVPMRLVPEPIELSDDATNVAADAYVQDGRRRADAYWQSTFGPAVDVDEDRDAAYLDQ